MHDDEPELRGSGGLKSPRQLKRAHVVQNRRTGFCRLEHDLGPRGIHRHAEAFPRESLHDRNHPGALLFERHRRRARARGFAAHVDDPGAVSAHLFRPGNSVRQGIVFAAVRQGIRGDVENAHDDGPVPQIKIKRTAAPEFLSHSSSPKKGTKKRPRPPEIWVFGSDAVLLQGLIFTRDQPALPESSLPASWGLTDSSVFPGALASGVSALGASGASAAGASLV